MHGEIKTTIKIYNRSIQKPQQAVITTNHDSVELPNCQRTISIDDFVTRTATPVLIDMDVTGVEKSKAPVLFF